MMVAAACSMRATIAFLADGGTLHAERAGPGRGETLAPRPEPHPEGAA
jgi:hypothetical protein